MTLPRIALIGAGIVAELYAKAFERGAGASFAGVFDPDPERAQAFTARLGGKVYGGRDDVLADPAVDAVLVLSPNHCHFDDACAALASGKHVLVEKPVAASIAEIAALERAAAAAGRVCMPAHNYIYMDSVIRMKRLLAEGRLGKLASLWILYNIFHSAELAKRYGGVLREVAVHHAYSLLFLAGRPVSVAAQQSHVHAGTLETESQVMLTCTMPGGALANLWVSFAASDHTADPWTVLYKVLGTKGGASFSWNDALVEDDGGPAWGITNYVDSFHTELSHFATQAIPGIAPPLSTLRDAREALAIIEAAERSIRHGGAAQHVIYD
ncbi:MAG: Gfo/Idh/MocA family oxidoreductase [Candidatus Kaistia colombiensis]|nr:MAG: Gfo/Idh/MocA family oxidoreductase [Kaistia sp.]